MQAGTTMMNAAPNTEPGIASRLPSVVLIVFAVLNGVSALSDASSVAMNLADNPHPGFTSWLLWSGVPIHFLLSIATLIYAVKRNVPRAIVALALMPIATWLTDIVPSAVTQGLDMRGSGGLITASQFAILPLLAIVAIVLARRNERLGLATFLAVLPSILAIAMVAAFAIGVMIYGF